MVIKSSEGGGVTSLMASFTSFIHFASKLVSLLSSQMGLQNSSKSFLVSSVSGVWLLWLIGSVYVARFLTGSFLMVVLQRS